MEPSFPSYEDSSMVFVFDLHEAGTTAPRGSGARYGSSDDGTHASSVVTSPFASSDDYLQPTPSPPGASPDVQFTQLSSAPSTLYQGSPERDAGHERLSSLPSTSPGDRRGGRFGFAGRDYPVCCLHPGCTARPFRRRADLDRHYKHRHAPDALKESFNCDYVRCTRRLEPFHRLDHFRDHLREYHKEDIEKRGGSHDDRWLVDRQVSMSWWRCPKCLKRVHIDRSGYECPNCRTSCQTRRKEVRQRD